MEELVEGRRRSNLYVVGRPPAAAVVAGSTPGPPAHSPLSARRGPEHRNTPASTTVWEGGRRACLEKINLNPRGGLEGIKRCGGPSVGLSLYVAWVKG